MNLMRDGRVVPSLMFHSVGLERHNWIWAHLSESVASFERKIALLRERGFRSVLWDELYAHMAGDYILPDNSIMLTFDDGYLDNWVYAYPILRKYAFKATIFVTPEFVDPSQQPRLTLEDVWAGRCAVSDLEAAGFLNWAEMREMESSGIIDVQSHALTHTWYFSSPKVVDFHGPEDPPPYPWLFWNARPECKPFYINEDQRSYVPWGSPILEHEKSLIVRRFFPENDALALFEKYVKANGGAHFLSEPDSKERLYSMAATEFGGSGLPGDYETDADRSLRLRHELAESKRLIEKNLAKTVNYICWPGGGNDRALHDLAKEVGYRAWTLGSQDQSKKRNIPGADPRSIKRMGTSNGMRLRGRHVGTGGEIYQLLRVFAHQGSAWHRLLLHGYRSLAAVGVLGRPC